MAPAPSYRGASQFKDFCSETCREHSSLVSTMQVFSDTWPSVVALASNDADQATLLLGAQRAEYDFRVAEVFRVSTRFIGYKP